MVEQSERLNFVFGALADPTRRDILRRVLRSELSVGEIAEPYKLSVAAVSKHLQVMEKARLVVKHRRGRRQFVHLAPAALRDADAYLQRYRAVWEDRFDRLEAYLKKEKK